MLCGSGAWVEGVNLLMEEVEQSSETLRTTALNPDPPGYVCLLLVSFSDTMDDSTRPMWGGISIQEFTKVASINQFPNISNHLKPIKWERMTTKENVSVRENQGIKVAELGFVLQKTHTSHAAWEMQ